MLYKNYDLGPKELFKKLHDLYECNGLYEKYEKMFYPQNNVGVSTLDHWEKIVRPILTCANRVTEFYVAKVAKNSKVTSDNQIVVDSIEQFYKWSNWEAQQDLAKRYLALYGNLFVKIIGTKEKIFSEILDPKTITSFKLDNRGYITELRLDISVIDDRGNLTNYTEYWSKDEGYYATWQSNMNTALTELQDLVGLIDSVFLKEFGVDFVPIVLFRFKDTGRPDKLGDGALNHVLDKLDYGNALINRAIDNLLRFNKPVTAITSQDQDASGQLNIPITEDIYSADDYAVISGGTIQSMTPQVDYASSLAMAQFVKNELIEDLPELKFYTLSETASGVALRSVMGGAISKAEGMQNIFISGLKRMNEIALTMGQFYGLFAVGSFDNGDYEHEISCDDIFPMSLGEKITMLKDMGVSLSLQVAMKLAGFSEDIITEATAQKQLEDKQKAEMDNQKFTNAMQSFNAGA